MSKVQPAHGKLAVLIPGLGAVATTLIAGVSLIRRGQSAAIGSLTQLGTWQDQPMSEALGLYNLDQLVFGGWDIYEGTCLDAAKRAKVLSNEHLQAASEDLAAIVPMPAVFDQSYIKNLSGPNVKTEGTKMDKAQALIEDIKSFMATHGADRAVAIWCGSTEAYIQVDPVHMSLEAFERGLREDHPKISPSMIYAYALISQGIPYANGAPNLTVDIPAILELAAREGVPVAGKDFKTGQTLMKTILAPGFAKRFLGVRGWYSTNILGNTDGHVLDDPASFKSKEKTKLSVLESILDKDRHPELYGDMSHKVRIDYYPPRGDNKEGWDNIDIFGWLGYEMQIKINFLCRDSILAAPVALDLLLLLDLASRHGEHGVQEWLSFYLKSPQTDEGQIPVHDLFEQYDMLEAKLEQFTKA